MACVVLLSISCNKPDSVGLNLLPGEDAMNVDFFDTLTLQTSYKQEDSLRTDAHLLYELQATNHQLMIGKYVDPVFGETSAELFTQLKPSAVFSNTNKTFDSLFLNLAYIDSLFLNLAYISNYGDTSALQTFEVYELTDAMYDTASYYSFNNLNYSTKVGEITFKVEDVKDSIVNIDSTKSAPRLRLRLDDVLGQKIFNSDLSDPYVLGQKIFNSDLSDPSKFKETVKGFCIKPAAASYGSIINFDAKTTVSSMIMYFTDPATTGIDSLPFYFYSSDGSIARFSRFTHDYSAFDFTNPLTDKAYVQTMGGIKTKITIPYLNNLKQLGPISINKAELIINVDPGTVTNFPAPDALSLYAIDSEGQIQTLPDLTRSSTLFGGGLANNQYRFNIAQFLQQILYEKRIDYGMYLRVRVPVAFQTPNRVALTGGDSMSTLRMKLQITYTKLNP